MTLQLEDWAAIATIAALVIAAVSLCALIFPAIRYVRIRSEDQRHRRYETYHQLVHDLAVGKVGDVSPFAECQIAAAFELRNYPEYRDVTCRILTGLEATWSVLPNPAVGRVIAEIQLTRQTLEKR